VTAVCRYRLYGVLLREPTDFHDVNEPGPQHQQHCTATAQRDTAHRSRGASTWSPSSGRHMSVGGSWLLHWVQQGGLTDLCGRPFVLQVN
jgi:hypothetical protein